LRRIWERVNSIRHQYSLDARSACQFTLRMDIDDIQETESLPYRPFMPEPWPNNIIAKRVVKNASEDHTFLLEPLQSRRPKWRKIFSKVHQDMVVLASLYEIGQPARILNYALRQSELP